jgi:lathosterol oxidase
MSYKRVDRNAVKYLLVRSSDFRTTNHCLSLILAAMDLVLNLADDYLLDKVWARLLPLNDHLSNAASLSTSANFTSITYLQQSAWPRDYIPRQMLSLTVITLTGIHILYFLFAWLSYKFIFNHEMTRHPRFLENQVKLEIQCSLRAFPVMTLLTLPWFQAEVMGYSQLYDNVEEYGWTYLALSVPL